MSYGECAARVGGPMAQEQVLCKREAVGITYLVGRPGVLIGHSPLSEVLAQPNVEYARFYSARA